MPTRSARIVLKNVPEWTNKHGNVVQRIERLYDVWNPPPPVSDGWGDLRLTIAGLQSILADAEQNNARVRAVGGAWSLSTAAATNGWLVNTRPLNWIFPLRANHVLPAITNVSEQIFVQCGTSVAEVNTWLANRMQALKTSGASNGQTIAGAVSTGTHGSAIDVGSMQEYVRGMHIITGGNKHIWLERKSDPVVSADLLQRLGADLVQDDGQFNSALVSFGSFGLIHALLIEVEPLFLLQSYRRRMAVDAQLRYAMETLDFTPLPMPHPGVRPFHFEVVVNPHDTAGGAYVTVMYKRPYKDDYIPPSQSSGGFGVGDDVLAFIGTLTDAIAPAVPVLVNTLTSNLYATHEDVWGTPGEIFCSTDAYGKATSTEIAVPLQRAAAALDALTAAHNEQGPFAGIFAFRYVKQSRATLAFTRFPVSCTIELPGVYSQRSVNFFNAVWRKLDAAGIPYTLHWGQENHFTPQRIQAMYGNAADHWVHSRNAILDQKGRSLFASPFLDSTGLA